MDSSAAPTAKAPGPASPADADYSATRAAIAREFNHLPAYLSVLSARASPQPSTTAVKEPGPPGDDTAGSQPSDPDFRCLVLVPLRPPSPRSLTDGKAVKRLHDLVVNRAQRADKVAHAEAEATLFRLRQLDAALAAVLAEDNLLFDGVTASGRDILEALQRE